MALAREIRLFLTGAEFLTRLPIPRLGTADRPPLAEAAKYFPLVGLLVGAISALVLLLASALPAPVAAGLAIGAGLLATGALHEDGFSDCCDGLGGGATRDHALEIMRDSRIGAYGAAGLIFSIGLRWAALAALDPWAGAAALLIAHSTGRAMITVTLSIAGYTRTEGLASSAAGVESRDALLALTLAFAAALAFGLGAGVLAFLAGGLAAAVMLWRLVRRLGGYTGDGLGAIEQVTEIAVLAVLAGAWG